MEPDWVFVGDISSTQTESNYFIILLPAADQSAIDNLQRLTFHSGFGDCSSHENDIVDEVICSQIPQLLNTVVHHNSTETERDEVDIGISKNPGLDQQSGKILPNSPGFFPGLAIWVVLVEINGESPSFYEN